MLVVGGGGCRQKAYVNAHGGRESKITKSERTYFMDDPLPFVYSLLIIVMIIYFLVATLEAAVPNFNKSFMILKLDPIVMKIQTEALVVMRKGK